MLLSLQKMPSYFTLTCVLSHKRKWSKVFETNNCGTLFTENIWISKWGILGRSLVISSFLSSKEEMGGQPSSMGTQGTSHESALTWTIYVAFFIFFAGMENEKERPSKLGILPFAS